MKQLVNKLQNNVCTVTYLLESSYKVDFKTLVNQLKTHKQYLNAHSRMLINQEKNQVRIFLSLILLKKEKRKKKKPKSSRM